MQKLKIFLKIQRTKIFKINIVSLMNMTVNSEKNIKIF